MGAVSSDDMPDSDDTIRRQRAIKRAKAEAARLLAKARALEAEVLEDELLQEQRQQQAASATETPDATQRDGSTNDRNGAPAQPEVPAPAPRRKPETKTSAATKKRARTKSPAAKPALAAEKAPKETSPPKKRKEAVAPAAAPVVGRAPVEEAASKADDTAAAKRPAEPSVDGSSPAVAKAPAEEVVRDSSETPSADKAPAGKTPVKTSGDAAPAAKSRGKEPTPSELSPRLAVGTSATPVVAKATELKLEETETEDTAGSRLWREWSGFAVSSMVHALLMIVLGLSLITVDAEARRNMMTALFDAEEEPLEESLLDELVDELKLETMEAVPLDVEDPGKAALGEIVGIEADIVEDVGSVAAVDSMTNVGTPWGDEGSGMTRAGSGTGGAEFYGVRSVGHRFVFIVDNSLSMSKGRFEAACIELYKTVSRMSAQQYFYVFFFSDTAYPLFHPNAVAEMVPVTTRNQYKLEAWLRTVELVLQTNARPAVQKAMAMNPDAIYILTDGAFTDNTFQYLMQLKPSRTAIHTVGMELKPEHEKDLKQIAKRHHGTYRLVHVDPRIRMMVGKKSRPGHRTPGPVWGIALGERGKKGGAKKGAAKKGAAKKGKGKKAKKP